MSHRVFIGTQPVAAVAPDDRGLAYGDGLFETMRAHDGQIPWLERHWTRLTHGAQRLGIPLPQRAAAEDAIDELLREAPMAGIVKLLVSRGAGGRGYAPPNAPQPSWIVSTHALQPVRERLAMIACSTRLAIQPALAGIKHCNRLEQVLARMEVAAAGADEGLLFDGEGALVSATAANVLVRLDGAWWTPPVDRCGVAGVMRGWLLEQELVYERAMRAEEVHRAEALAACNAVRGILAVRSLDGHAWPKCEATAILRATLAQAVPMFGEG